MRVIEKEKLRENAVKQGDYTVKRLKEWVDQYEIVGDVRGKGLMIGVEIITDKKTKKQDGDAAHDIIYHAWKKGVVAIGAGENCFRIAPPLVITRDLLDFGLDKLEESVKEVMKAK
jgi:4-aminobutyrate aminotransferase